MSYFDAIPEALAKALGESIKATPAGRAKVVELVMKWIADNCKQSDPNLTLKLEAFKVRLKTFVNTLSVEMKDEKLRVTARGEGEQTLVMLRRGSGWFKGNPEIDTLLLAALSA